LEFSSGFNQLKQAEKELQELEEAEARAKMDEDYFRFQWNELQSFDFDKIDLKLIEEELETLGNAEEIKRQLQAAWTLLSGNEGSAIEQISLALAGLIKVSKYNSAIAELTQRLELIKTDLKEAGRDLERCDQHVIYDEERIRELEQLTGKLFELQHKHRLNELADLVRLKAELEQKIAGLGSLECTIKSCKDKIEAWKKNLDKLGKELHTGRKKSAELIASDVSALLVELQMPHACIDIELKELEHYNEYGKDAVNLLFRSNKGGTFKPIQKVASGGELSRIMLALKSALSKYRELPTLILDEIDTGVSGEVAARMGKVMKGLTSESQVIAITHLPQIAGTASYHFKVYKEVGENDTTTHVKQLKKEERVKEIAALLSGTSTSDAALKHARILLEQ
jgi:DNA repair protein RecN (Recombination protein N)